MDKLVERMLQGDEKAVVEFYKEFSGDLRKYLRMKLPAEAVEEILQDIFISALDSLGLYRGRASLKSWLKGIARHEIADFYRKRYVRRAVEITSKLFEGVGEEIKTPEWELQKKEVKERLERVMRGLNRRYREVLYWRFEVGLSVKEVAERMNLSFKATESLLFRARKAFVLAYENDREGIS